MASYLPILLKDFKEASVEFKELTNEQVDQLEECLKNESLDKLLRFCRLLPYRCDHERILRLSQSTIPQVHTLCHRLLHIPKIEKKFIEGIHTAEDLLKKISTSSDVVSKYLINVAFKYIQEESFYESVIKSKDPIFGPYENQSLYKSSPKFVIGYYKERNYYPEYLKTNFTKKEEILELLVEELLTSLDAIVPDDEIPDLTSELISERTKECNRIIALYSWVFDTVIFKKTTHNGKTMLGFNFFLDFLKKVRKTYNFLIVFYTHPFTSTSTPYKEQETNVPKYKTIRLQKLYRYLVDAPDLFLSLFFVAPLYVIKSLDLFSSPYTRTYIQLNRFVDMYYYLKAHEMEKELNVLINHFAISCVNSSIFSSSLGNPKNIYVDEDYLTLKKVLNPSEYKAFFTYLIAALKEECQVGMVEKDDIPIYINIIRYIYLVAAAEEPNWLGEENIKILQDCSYFLYDLSKTMVVSSEITVAIYSCLDKELPFKFSYFNWIKEMKGFSSIAFDFEKCLCAKNNSYLYDKDETQRAKVLVAILTAASHVHDLRCTQRVIHAILTLFLRDPNVQVPTFLFTNLMTPYCLGFHKEMENDNVVRDRLIQDFEEWCKNTPDKKASEFMSSIISACLNYSSLYPEYEEKYYSFYYKLMENALKLNQKLSGRSAIPYRSNYAMLKFFHETPLHTLIDDYLYKMIHKQEEYIEKNEIYDQFNHNFYYRACSIVPSVKPYDYAEYYPNVRLNVVKAVTEFMLNSQYDDNAVLLLFNLILNSYIIRDPFLKSVTITDVQKTYKHVKVIQYIKPIDKNFFEELLTVPNEDSSKVISGLSVYQSFCTIHNYLMEGLPKDPESKVISDKYDHFTEKEKCKNTSDTSKEIKKIVGLYKNSTKRYHFYPTIVEDQFDKNKDNYMQSLASLVASLPSLPLQNTTYKWYNDMVSKVCAHSEIYRNFGLNLPLETNYRYVYNKEYLEPLYIMAVDSFYLLMHAVYFRIYFYLYDEKGIKSTYNENYHHYLYEYLYYILMIQNLAKFNNIQLPSVQKDIYIYSDIVAPFYNISIEETEHTTLEYTSVELTNIDELLKPIFITFNNKSVQDIFKQPSEATPITRRRGSSKSKPKKTNSLSKIIDGLFDVFLLLPKDQLKKLFACFLSTSESVLIVHTYIDYCLKLTGFNSEFIDFLFDILIPQNDSPVNTQYLSLLFVMGKHRVIHDMLHVHPVDEFVAKWNKMIMRIWTFKNLPFITCFYLVKDTFNNLMNDPSATSYLDMIGNMKNETTIETSFIQSFVYASTAFFADSRDVIRDWINAHFSDASYTSMINDIEKQFSDISKEKETQIRNVIMGILLKLVHNKLNDTTYAIFNLIASYCNDTTQLGDIVEIAKQIVYGHLVHISQEDQTTLLSSFYVLSTCVPSEFKDILTKCYRISNIGLRFMMSKSSVLESEEKELIYSVMDGCGMERKALDTAIQKSTIHLLLYYTFPTVLVNILSTKNTLMKMYRFFHFLLKLRSVLKELNSLIPLNYKGTIEFLCSMVPYMTLTDKKVKIDLESFIRDSVLDEFPTSSLYAMLKSSNLFDHLDTSDHNEGIIRGYRTMHNITGGFCMLYFKNQLRYSDALRNEDINHILYLDATKYPCLLAFNSYFCNI